METQELALVTVTHAMGVLESLAGVGDVIIVAVNTTVDSDTGHHPLAARQAVGGGGVFIVNLELAAQRVGH